LYEYKKEMSIGTTIKNTFADAKNPKVYKSNEKIINTIPTITIALTLRDSLLRKIAIRLIIRTEMDCIIIK
jgi:hypothetical protein